MLCSLYALFSLILYNDNVNIGGNMKFSSYSSLYCFQLHDKLTYIAIYRGKYLQRRIPHASHGSFNPYIITNKEAHIINGNITEGNIKNNKATFARQLSLETNDTHPGRYSCAVDSFLELAFAIFRDSLQHIKGNEFFETLYEACLHLQNCNVDTDMSLIREPVWSYLRQLCNSFASMSAHAVFSDIFTLNTVGTMNQQLESLFLIQQKNQSVCSSCNNEIVKNTCLFVIYITCQNLGHGVFENCVCDAILPSSRALFCDLCQQHSGVVSVLQHFVTLPRFLLVELSSNCISQIYFPLSMDVLGEGYELKGMVRCISHHFTIAVNNYSEWIYIDDLCVSVRRFSSVQDLLNSYPNGCFFAIFGKSLCTVPNDLQTNFMPCQTSLLADKCHKTVESLTQPQEPEMCFISGKFNFSPCQTEHKTQQDMCNEKKRRRSEIMRIYRAKIKCKKVSETNGRLKLDAQKSYMKEYRKKKSANTNDRQIEKQS